MKKSFILALITLFLFTTCRKKEPYIEPAITFSDVKAELVSDLIALVEYEVLVQGTPSVRESGTIFTTDSEVSYFNFKLVDEDSLIQFKKLYVNVEAETHYYVRPYVITYQDTLYGDIQSFMSGSYFKVGNGVTDNEGHVYQSIILGSQEWMAENLRTQFFCNGDSIQFSSTDSIFMLRFEEPQIIFFDFNSDYFQNYGLMYNGYAALDARNICPCGWRVPTKSDWDKLFIYLGNNKYVGGKMKSVGVLEEGTGLWKSPNGLANNLSGFNALPGGSHFGPNSFWHEGGYAQFALIDYNYYGGSYPFRQLSIDYIRGEINVFNQTKQYTNYVRCVKDN